jgi:hypothetical protein
MGGMQVKHCAAGPCRQRVRAGEQRTALSHPGSAVSHPVAATLTSHLCVQLVALNREALVKALHQLGKEQPVPELGPVTAAARTSSSCATKRSVEHPPHTSRCTSDC